jgi:phosphoglycerate dehydrogenase-like enzyme
MGSKMRIVVDAPLPEGHAQRIRSLSPDIELVETRPFGGALPRETLARAEVVYTTAADFDPGDAPRLRWVQLNVAATDSIADKPIARGSIPIANASGAYSVAVAECALAMLLALTRRITLGCRFQAEARWPDDMLPWTGDDLHGMTLGIAGYGSIGRQVARVASAMGAEILACKRNPSVRRDESFLLPGTGDPEGVLPRVWFGAGEIRELFRRSDAVVLAIPHVPSTERMIGAAELAALRPGAYLVNVGRGAVLDEAALVRTLASGSLAGAALDVFTEEPLPSRSPLWGLDNVLVLPHIASLTRTQARRAADVLIANLERNLAGRPLLNLVDKDLMY